jgi:2-C-methyl-D-erythritol 4-phosphate cytidylyltransferase/2-C-methyl-D-erythritol 2,4-cyclodiphosphate synthase
MGFAQTWQKRVMQWQAGSRERSAQAQRLQTYNSSFDDPVALAMSAPDSHRPVASRPPTVRHFAVVPAAGTGSRMGADRPKQYLTLGTATILERTVARLLDATPCERVIVVVSPGDTVAQALPGLTRDPRVQVAAVGGTSRRDSVLAGLKVAAEDHGAGAADWIWVHDAARPGIDRDSIERLTQALIDEPVGALLALPMADTVKRSGVTEGAPRVLATVAREDLWQAQTPQVFRYGPLRQALAQHAHVTDEASAIEAAGQTPRLVPGSRSNFKVTTMDDLRSMQAAELHQPARSQTEPAWRIGQGWDVHALVPGRALVIGGTTIDHDRGLLGHSDADVLIHAVIDAMLGAAGLGDIGRHFSDTDPVYRGADSRVLLREACKRIREAGWSVGNVDATVVAQSPKMAPYIASMVGHVASDLGLQTGQVNVKAKTSERLGFAGRGEGIEAHAVVMLVRAVQAG